MKELVMVGGGGHAKVLLEILLRSKAYKIVGLTDPKAELIHQKVLGVPVMGNDQVLPELRRVGVKYAFVGIGSVGRNFARRAATYEKLKRLGFKLPNIIHPTAVIAQGVRLGAGNAILAKAIINAGVCLGNNTIINSGAIIEHDCMIADHVHVATGAMLAGGVEIGEASHIGIGAIIKQGVRIGKNVVVGAGAVVIEDVPEGLTVVGLPARALS